jgi:hypothetical protein
MDESRSHNTPSTPPNAVTELPSVLVSSSSLSTTAVTTRYVEGAPREIEDFCTDHLSSVPQDLERDGLDSLVKAFLSAKADARYSSLCKLLNTLSQRTGTHKQLVVVTMRRPVTHCQLELKRLFSSITTTLH